MKDLEEYRSQCDCCGKMKYGCVDLWISYVGDTHACPECRGEAEENHENFVRADKRFAAEWAAIDRPLDSD